MRVHGFTHLFRLLWLAIPWTVGAALGDSLSRSNREDAVATVVAWVLWAIVAGASLWLTPAALSVVRTVTPCAPAVTAWALVDAPTVEWRGIVGLTCAIGVTALSWSAPVADDFVDGLSYGDERRFALRAPGVLALGPIAAVTALATVGLVTAPLAFATGRTALGIGSAVVGVGVAAAATRSLHTLSSRALVFVPNGVTVVDPMTLTEPVFFARRDTLAFGPAPAETEAVDLSMRALGMPLQLTMRAPVPLGLTTSRRAATLVESARVLVAPARPGAALLEASRRNFGTATAAS